MATTVGVTGLRFSIRKGLDTRCYWDDHLDDRASQWVKSIQLIIQLKGSDEEVVHIIKREPDGMIYWQYVCLKMILLNDLLNISGATESLQGPKSISRLFRAIPRNVYREARAEGSGRCGLVCSWSTLKIMLVILQIFTRLLDVSGGHVLDMLNWRFMTCKKNDEKYGSGACFGMPLLSHFSKENKSP